jgi:IclR family KDG regulon transcriptional repressor
MNDISDINKYLLDYEEKFFFSKSVFRITNILICLSHGISSLTNIANACNVHKSTTHRLLGALCKAKVVMQDPVSQQYSLGPLISEMAANPKVTHQGLIVCAANEMRALANYSGETIGLAGLIGLQQLSLFEVPSIYDFRIVVQKMFTDNLHAGATSRVLLSQINKKELTLVTANMDFKPVTDNTITYREQWFALLNLAREQGYAVSYGERILGAMSISFPIKNYLFPVALDMVGPEARIKPRLNEFLAELKICATNIEKNIKRMIEMK